MSLQIVIILLPLITWARAGETGYESMGGQFAFATYGPVSFVNGVYGEMMGAPVHAAIATRRTYEVRPIMLQSEPAVPSVVDVQASEQPVKVIFRTHSSPVMVQQVHTPSVPAQVERTNSEDEPHRVMHEVIRPVIQEVREIIQPFRRVTQEVRPVLEEIHTVVAKGDKVRDLPPGMYQEEHPGGKNMILGEEGMAYAPLMSNELGAAVMYHPTPHASNHMAMASSGSEIYMDPSMHAALLRLVKEYKPTVRNRRSRRGKSGRRA